MVNSKSLKILSSMIIENLYFLGNIRTKINLLMEELLLK